MEFSFCDVYDWVFSCFFGGFFFGESKGIEKLGGCIYGCVGIATYFFSNFFFFSMAYWFAKVLNSFFSF